jgi:hypothetical protein
MKTRALLTLAIALAGTAAVLGGCAHDDDPGRSTTVRKETVNTPEGKTTYTEKREKETTITPK